MGDASLPDRSDPLAAHLTVVNQDVWQLLPLSRKGTGPGLIVITPGDLEPEEACTIKNGVPSPLMKWAEESYTVMHIRSSALMTSIDPLRLAIEALSMCPTVEEKGRYGLIVYDSACFQAIESQLVSMSEIVGAVIYGEAATGLLSTRLPTVQHLAGEVKDRLPRTQQLTAYSYPKAKSELFAVPSSTDFDYASEAVSHTRSLTFLKHHAILGGPIFDLEEIWDEHTYYEFGDRNVEKTMATMVQEPYVNHIPTLTGGIGREQLTDFYTHHFIFSNPDDAELELISRTVGIDRVVDEFLYKFTHDRTVDWLMPSMPPTGHKIEVPMMAVVNIRGDRLYHEHIHWDQGTTLRQAGMLPEYLPWPTKLGKPGTQYLEETTRTEEAGSESQLAAHIPVAGLEAASKLRDKNATESNTMFRWRMGYR